MSDPNSGTSAEPLQFDRAVEAGAAPEGTSEAAPAALITCSNCQTQIKTYYYNVDDNAVCAKCKQEISRAVGAQTGGKAWIKAAVFGFGASLVGAGIYYGVYAVSGGYQLSIIAILIGFLVGAAVRKGASGAGGRRYQFLAVGLTYFAMGLAFAPVAYKEIAASRTPADSAARQDSSASTAQVGDSTTAGVDSASSSRGDSTAAEPAVQLAGNAKTPARSRDFGILRIPIAIGALIVLILSLPVVVVFGSLPGGIISAIIYGVGLHTAWRTTQGHSISITGPYKVGSVSAGEGGETPPAAATA